MKNNIYIFSNSLLSRKDNSFILQTIDEIEPQHNIDLYESENENLILPVKKEDTTGKPKYIPAESIEAFYTFGEMRFNTQFFKCVSKYNIPVHMFNYYGNYIGSFLPVDNNNSGEIQIRQYESYLNNRIRLNIAKAILEAAIRNILFNLRLKNYKTYNIDAIIGEIITYLELIRFADSIKELFGYEGTVRNLYYSVWGHLIKGESDFNKRIKYPPGSCTPRV